MEREHYQPRLASRLAPKGDTCVALSVRAADGIISDTEDGISCRGGGRDLLHPWLSIDLGCLVNVNGIVLYNRRDCRGELLANVETHIGDVLSLAGGNATAAPIACSAYCLGLCPSSRLLFAAVRRNVRHYGMVLPASTQPDEGSCCQTCFSRADCAEWPTTSTAAVHAAFGRTAPLAGGGPGLPNVYEGSWVETFNQAGFSVCGLDHQGYGRSKGARFGIKFQTHVDNLLMLSGDVLENDNTAFPKGLPYFLVGHSLGGLLATLACLHQPQLFTGLILLSPLLSLDRPIAKRNNSLRSLSLMSFSVHVFYVFCCYTC
ncbi:hypothetical protein VOLCADRAFT_88747 [Volvox carteri f. nagariensis]|uniref:Serine aminopeptidase S33 domain-containing protein n=1 Tax=Volvox carteri f. nagariensis TaxID=3068 RepID=D8TPU8_VOLCA|nr:uncharacterized protein VOLCADRAFT_88747 [Volvox carteri f. nagariensis]EFJ50291.1 hypothetical protein VOLCADRAFT_88747 [Volvox carteri f. nagariensis]|eukprot:XP_002948416.1 hypothetical protein VOLCADRAFT_88747 [Volvox carteri f. nagariensis]